MVKQLEHIFYFEYYNDAIVRTKQKSKTTNILAIAKYNKDNLELTHLDIYENGAKPYLMLQISENEIKRLRRELNYYMPKKIHTVEMLKKRILYELKSFLSVAAFKSFF